MWFNLAQEGLVEIREDYVEEDSNEGEFKSGMFQLYIYIFFPIFKIDIR